MIPRPTCHTTDRRWRHFKITSFITNSKAVPQEFGSLFAGRSTGPGCTAVWPGEHALERFAERVIAAQGRGTTIEDRIPVARPRLFLLSDPGTPHSPTRKPRNLCNSHPRPATATM
jgi:hypothetical protein